MSDRTDLIVELIKGLKDDQKQHREEMKDHQKQSLDWHNKFDSRMDNLEADMKEHIEGVKQNRSKNEAQDLDILDLNVKHKANVERIDKIEEPNKARLYIRNKILQAGGLAAAIVGIIKLVEYFSK